VLLEYKNAPRVVNCHSRFACRTNTLTIDHLVYYPFWRPSRESKLVVLATTPHQFLLRGCIRPKSCDKICQ